MRHILCLLLLGAFIGQLTVLAQNEQKRESPYFFEGDEIVFEFDSRAYQKATDEKSEEKLDFADLDIYRVSVSGECNNWSRKKWRMIRVGPYTFQLRKKIKDIDDQFTWQFKFLVNGQFWAEPDEKTPNRVYVDEDWEDIFNLQLNTYEADKNGNAYFFLKGFKNAKKVILSGEFNSWSTRKLKMTKAGDGWEMRIKLEPGRYEYKFIVDGEWMHDPANPNRVENVHGTYNSILDIKKIVTFKLKDYQSAKQVTLAGTFNDWNPSEIYMKQSEEGWMIKLSLIAGKHLYKFVVDGNWIVDPNNPLKENDRKGIINSILFVQ